MTNEETAVRLVTIMQLMDVDYNWRITTEEGTAEESPLKQ